MYVQTTVDPDQRYQMFVSIPTFRRTKYNFRSRVDFITAQQQQLDVIDFTSTQLAESSSAYGRLCNQTRPSSLLTRPECMVSTTQRGRRMYRKKKNRP